MRMIRSWNVMKAFFNADLNEVIYFHPRTNLCKAGHCWWLRNALHGTRMASQKWGETVRAVMDSGRWHCLQSVPNACTLSELDRLLNEHFEVTAWFEVGSILRRQGYIGVVLSFARPAKWYPRGW